MTNKFNLGEHVETKDGAVDYIVKDIIKEPTFNSIVYNDYTEYSGPHNKSFYESELQLKETT